MTISVCTNIIEIIKISLWISQLDQLRYLQHLKAVLKKEKKS